MGRGPTVPGHVFFQIRCQPLTKTGGPGTATAANGVSRRQPEAWLLMLVVVRAAGTGHLLTVKEPSSSATK
jgi:hypothetical protein